MRAFLADWWWVLSFGALSLIVIVHRYRKRPRFPAPQDARSFGAVRVLRADELRPYFGTYVPRFTDLMGLALLAGWFALLVGVVVWSFTDKLAVPVASAAAFGLVAIAAMVLDARSVRIIGPNHIAFESPISRFSWSVPLDMVQQCDLVPGKPHPRLRVHTTQSSFTLPLTTELWSALSGRAA